MEITATEQVYTLDELSDDARKVAIERMAEEWGEFMTVEQVSATVGGRFARLAAGDEWEDKSDREIEERFGVRIGWDVYHGDASITGTLYRHKCPALAWPDGVGSVSVREATFGGYTITDVGASGDAEGWIVPDDAREAAEDMVRDLTAELLRAATEEYEFQVSEEHMTELYEINGDRRRFLADGRTAPHQFWSDDDEPQVRAV